LTFILLTVALTALFWGLSVVVQGYLYSQPADKLPLRALVAGLLVACFLTFWTYTNTRASHPDKYGTFFEFSPTATRNVDEFEAVRRLAYKDANGQPKEETMPFRWQSAGGGGRFVNPATNQEFRLNTASYMTVALLVPEGDQTIRFDAVLNGDTYATPTRRFVEEGGSRYIDGTNPRLMVVPSSSAFALALLLNFAHFLVWLLAFWPNLRYSFGPALMLTILFGGVTMVVVMPMLFQMNTPKPMLAA
jgi:hypothetical protein